jgi:hypothetical protein
MSAYGANDENVPHLFPSCAISPPPSTMHKSLQKMPGSVEIKKLRHPPPLLFHPSLPFSSTSSRWIHVFFILF